MLSFYQLMLLLQSSWSYWALFGPTGTQNSFEDLQMMSKKHTHLYRQLPFLSLHQTLSLFAKRVEDRPTDRPIRLVIKVTFRHLKIYHVRPPIQYCVCASYYTIVVHLKEICLPPPPHDIFLQCYGSLILSNKTWDKSWYRKMNGEHTKLP